KTLLLRLVGDMEKKLANRHAVAREIALEAADILKTLFPNVFCDQIRRQLLLFQKFPMHPHHQRLLIVAAIKNTDAAALGQTFHATPEVIVVEVFAGRRLERKNLAALRVDAG